MELLSIQYAVLGHMLVYPEHVGEMIPAGSGGL